MRTEVELPDSDKQIVFLVEHSDVPDRYFIGGVFDRLSRENTVGLDWIEKEQARYDYVVVRLREG